MRDYTHPVNIEEARLASACADAYETLAQVERRMFNDPTDAREQATDKALAAWRKASTELQDFREESMIWQQDTPAGPIYLPAP